MGILIVDDDPAIRDVFAEILSDEGYTTVTAEHGRAALTYLETGRSLPRLILLDLMMPIMNGWEFAVAVKEHPVFVAIPIVVMSAGGNLVEAARALRVADAIPKPIYLDSLLGTVQRFLGPPRPPTG